MNNPVLSVIVPVFNAEKYLADCLVSILEQKIEGIQIIVVNDGSTDGSQLIIETYAKKYSCIIHVETENFGVSSARNTAMSMSTGDFIAFCDSDDIVPAYAYARMLKKKSSDVIVGNMRVFREHETYSIKYSNKDSKFLLLMKGPSLCNRMFKRTFIEKEKFKNLDLGEDVVFLSDVLKLSPKTSLVKTFVYCYRHKFNINSLTHQFNCNSVGQHLSCWSMVRKTLEDKYKDELNEYLIRNFMGYILNNIYKIESSLDKIQALLLLRDFFNDIDYNEKEMIFYSYTNLRWSEFSSLESEYLLEKISSSNLKNQLLVQYEHGIIGLSFLKDCFIKWMKYKLKNRGENNEAFSTC